MTGTDLTPGNRLRTTVLGERPQERMANFGASALSDTELLAILLRKGTRGLDVLSLAHLIVTEAGSLSGLIGWRETDFRRFKGVGRIKAQQLVAVIEVVRRVVQQQQGEAPLLNRPEQILSFLFPLASGLDVEKFWVLSLNRRNRLIRCNEITSGTATSTLAHPREVFREALRQGASAIVCAHNHPSGDPVPSAADIRITRQLRESAQTLDIDLLDHIIVGRASADPKGLGYYSFRANGGL